MSTSTIQDLLGTIAQDIGERVVEEKFSLDRYDFIFFEAKKLVDAWKYDDAKMQLEKYLWLVFLPNANVLDLYIIVLKELWLYEAAEQYVIRKNILLSTITKQEEKVYIDSRWSQLIYEDAYLYEHKRYLCFFHKINDPWAWKGEYTLFSDFNSLIHQKKSEVVEADTYSYLLSTDNKTISHSILIFVWLYKDYFDIPKKKEYIYRVLQYEDVFYENLRNDSMSNHHKAYLYLSTFSELNQEKLYFLLKAYIIITQAPKITIDIQITHKLRLEEKIISIYWKIYKQKNEHLQSFQFICVNLIPDFAERIKEKYDKGGKIDKPQQSIEKKENFKQWKMRVLFSYVPFVILFFIVSFVIYIFINA